MKYLNFTPRKQHSTKTDSNYKHKGKRPKRKIKMYQFANTAENCPVSGWGVFPLDAQVRQKVVKKQTTHNHRHSLHNGQRQNALAPLIANLSFRKNAVTQRFSDKSSQNLWDSDASDLF